MTIDRDDPKLTAFALDELAAAERAQLEAELAGDPEALEEVAQLRELASQLEAEFAAEPTPTLTADQRAAVLAAGTIPERSQWRMWAAAAGVGLLVYGGLTVGQGEADRRAPATTHDRLVSSVEPGDTVPADGEWRDGPASDPGFRRDSADGRRDLNLSAEVPPADPEEPRIVNGAGSTNPIEPTLDPTAVTPEDEDEDQWGWEEEFEGTIDLPRTREKALRPNEKKHFSPSFAKKDRNGVRGEPVVGGGTVVFGLPGEQNAGPGPQTDGTHQWGNLPLTTSGTTSPEAVRIRGLVARGQAQAQAGKFGEAIELYNQAIELDPASGTLLNRGTVMLRAGDLDAAIQDFDRGLALLSYRDKAALEGVRLGLAQAQQEGPEAVLHFVHRVVIEQSPTSSHTENPFRLAKDAPLSTFSVDVDTAAYAQMRRSLRQNHTWPAAGSVRVEELINYFDYDYAPPAAGAEHPFATHVEVATCPWNPANRLVRVALKGYEVQAAERPASNLVFLLDVSGSMSSENKLPLLKRALHLLVQQLNGNDKVAIVVYAGASGLVLDSTSGSDKNAILKAIDRLQSGGSTNGGAGIELAYTVASRNYIEGGVNRVILATDGDFNVGVTQRDQLLKLIEGKAKSKVFLSVLGLGMRDSSDATMEQLADHGNGVYACLDTIREAKKVLVDEMSGTLFTIAKDVKLQLEFNPSKVSHYRLIGYENRVLAAKDFNDDTKDAGEIGAGHTVTALYEVVPANKEQGGVDPLRYQPEKNAAPVEGDKAAELLFLKLRYKQPEGDTSKLLSVPVFDRGKSFAKASHDFRFASAVAAYGMILRNSPHRGSATLKLVEAIAQENPGRDLHGYRAEFVELVALARQIAGR